MALGKFFAKTNTELGERITKLENDLAASVASLEKSTLEQKALTDSLAAVSKERDDAAAKVAALTDANAKLATDLEAAQKQAANAAAVSAPKVVDAAVELAARQGIPVKDAPGADENGGVMKLEAALIEYRRISESGDSKAASEFYGNVLSPLMNGK